MLDNPEKGRNASDASGAPWRLNTPHIGAQSAEAQTRAGQAIAEEVIAVLQGKEPRWRVLAND